MQRPLHNTKLEEHLGIPHLPRLIQTQGRFILGQRLYHPPSRATPTSQDLKDKGTLHPIHLNQLLILHKEHLIPPRTHLTHPPTTKLPLADFPILLSHLNQPAILISPKYCKVFFVSSVTIVKDWMTSQ